MTKNSTLLTILLSLIFLIACGQNSKPTPANKFLDFLNNYQIDSLQLLVSDNFHIKRTFGSYINNKKSFIEKYVPTSKNLNGKFIILNSTESGLATFFLVEDQSDYFKYLNIDFPKWKVRITTNVQEKIESMVIDTTESYQTYIIQMKDKSEPFVSWMKQKYPTETMEVVYNTEGLLSQRLNEYLKCK